MDKDNVSFTCTLSKDVASMIKSIGTNRSQVINETIKWALSTPEGLDARKEYYTFKLKENKKLENLMSKLQKQKTKSLSKKRIDEIKSHKKQCQEDPGLLPLLVERFNIKYNKKYTLMEFREIMQNG